MAGMYEYNHAGAKIKAMKAKLLQREDYERLIQMPNVKEAALYLKNSTCYQEALRQLDENDVHRGHLEILLYRSIMEDSDKISHYVSGYEKELFYYIYTDHEVEDIKKMLRFLRLGHPLTEMDIKNLFLDKHSTIDFNKCLLARNDEELLEALKGSGYYAVLKPLMDENGNLPLFEIELALDYYSYQEIIRHIEHFKMHKAKELALEMFGHIIDYKNIMFIYRGRHYYHLPKEMLYRYTIPLFYHLSKQDITDMIEAGSLEEVIQIVDRSFYGQIFNLRKKGVALSFRRFMREHWSHLMNVHPFGLASILGYFYLKEVEIIDITAIIEGIRYSIGSSIDLAEELIYPLSRKGERTVGS
ncbi:hypothetical protein EII17_03260 [Clostridiales bacterium COT073_COT-073]|nr:hypothetical protein EII17_03260 [Clostridiales bacterium COT073_COT-073]